MRRIKFPALTGAALALSACMSVGGPGVSTYYECDRGTRLKVDYGKEYFNIIDFTGTGPQAKGPINHCGDYSDGVFLKKWLAPILRSANLSITPPSCIPRVSAES